MKRDFMDEAGNFARGTVDGVVSSGLNLVELCKHPDKIVDAIRGASDAVANAAAYYRHTSPENVARDAADAVRLAAAMPAYERGKIGGEFAFGVLLGEGAGFAGKLLNAETKVALRCGSSEEFEQLMREISTSQELPDRLQLAPSAEFAAEVDAMTRALPEHVKKFLALNNVRIVSMKELTRVWPTLDKPSGIFSYGPENPTAIWLGETAHWIDGALDAKKLELTLRHEIAHATDCFAGGKAGWLSDSEELRHLIDREIMKLTPLERNDLWRCFSRGSERFLRQEIVAELVARTAIPRGTFRDELFRRMFPNTNKYLHAPGSHFLFNK